MNREKENTGCSSLVEPFSVSFYSKSPVRSSGERENVQTGACLRRRYKFLLLLFSSLVVVVA